MKVLLLGTGAADGVPGYWGRTRVNDYARKHGGKDVRTRTAALIDGVLKIDFGPDTGAQVNRERIDPLDWEAIVFTHSHDDHLCESELQYALTPFNPNKALPFTVYGNAEVLKRVRAAAPGWAIQQLGEPFEPSRLIETASFRTFEHGPYRITPIHANHKHDEDAQNLIVEKEGVTFLYASDTGVYFEETWCFLEGWRLDGMVIECSEGLAWTAYDGHLDVEECKQMVARMRECGVLKPGAPVVTTHHSHQGDATHADLEQALNPFDIQVGYDGMVVEIQAL